MANQTISDLSFLAPVVSDVVVFDPATGDTSKKYATKLPSYTVATVPSAVTYVGCLIYVSDGTANKRLAVSDGTNWRFPDGAIVS